MKGILIYIMRVLRLIGLPPQKAFPKQAFSGPGSLPKFWFVVTSFANNFSSYQCALSRNEKLYKRGIESMVPQLKANASAIDLLKNVCGQNVIIVRFNSFFFLQRILRFDPGARLSGIFYAPWCILEHLFVIPLYVQARYCLNISLTPYISQPRRFCIILSVYILSLMSSAGV